MLTVLVGLVVMFIVGSILENFHEIILSLIVCSLVGLLAFCIGKLLGF